MANSSYDGPLTVSGNLSGIPQSLGIGMTIAEPNLDAGPSKFYQGTALLDPRMIWPRDKVTGYTGVEQAHILSAELYSADVIPAATAANNIAAAQNATSGTAFTLAAASFGVAVNIPIHPFGRFLNGIAPVTAAMALDFGFAYGATTAGSPTVTVLDSTIFPLGMPVVIGGVGNSGGTVPLLTNVIGQPSATTITLATNALATSTGAPIGTGDLWGPSENGFPTPTAAYPFFAGGPGLFLDPRQTLARGVRITGVSGGAGGTFTVAGWDIYNQPMTQTVTVAAGASTGYSLKTFKYIASVTPNFTDAHNYTVGTSDVFGFSYRVAEWERASVFWAGLMMTSSTGWLIYDGTNPATAATGDVRGVIQVSTIGAGTGIGSTASNGSISGVTVSGNRFVAGRFETTAGRLLSTQLNPQFMFGVTQA